MKTSPARRSVSRLSLLDTSPSLSSSVASRNPSPVLRSSSEDEEARYPGSAGTPTKSRHPRRASSLSLPRLLDKVQSSWRRVPFLVWIVSISLYCCVVYLRMGDHRDLMANRFVTKFHQQSITNNEKSSTPELKSDETSKSIASMKQYDHTKNIRRRNVHPAAEKTVMTAQSTKLVHVVETRFMQQQSSLLELGLARLALFEAFCLPSMLAQTNPNFLWIIRADPSLHPSLVSKLQELLQGRQNFILLGSNSNPEGFGRPRPKLPFQSFLRFDNVTATVWNGNISLVEEAYERSAAGTVLLETRLDSDDGVNIHFIEMVQAEALKNLIVDSNSKDESNGNLWRLWCIESRLEWHPLNPYPDTPEIAAVNISLPEGYLVYYSEHGCSTPGLTFGYGRGASRDSLDSSLNISHLRHDEISKKIRKCKNKKSDDIEVECVSRLSELKPGAVRARTTTSAGMANVITGHRDIDKKNGFKRLAKNKSFVKQFTEQQTFWMGLSSWLDVSLEDAKFARSIILGRMTEIAMDNLKGQCTGGHSCKDGTKAVLGRLAEAGE